jgi:hypothetical protein
VAGPLIRGAGIAQPRYDIRFHLIMLSVPVPVPVSVIRLRLELLPLACREH